MHSYKLTYFNVRARGENARMMFAAAGVTYEDNRIEFKDWPAIKDSTPQGSLPILEVDGKLTLVENKAINRYLAREFGFYGKNNFESMQIDIVTEVVDEIFSKLIDGYYCKDDAKKEEIHQKIYTEMGPKKFKFLEKMLSENDGGNSFFVGKSLTLADINFIFVMDYYVAEDITALDKYPKLKALRERVMCLEKIAAWITKRPVTSI